MTREQIRLGAGAGFAGDRIEPALELVEHGALDFLVFECLAERTIALAQLARLAEPDKGFDPLLARRMEAVLPAAKARGVRIVTNMGAANPRAAAREVARVARTLKVEGLRIAAVTGDDVLAAIRRDSFPFIDRQGTTADLGERILSANAYLGAEGIAMALDGGANVVICGRVCDPALFVGPLIHSFGWDASDWSRLAKGTMVGHLLECAGQLTGGYFVDPGMKDVPDLARLGFPFADVTRDGDATFGKVTGSGGRIDLATCKEQLLYEILDPASYLQADVVADFTAARFAQISDNKVFATGARGRERPRQLKVSVGYRDGFLGEGQISYAGPNSLARARLALAIVRERLAMTAIDFEELRTDVIGVDALGHTGPRNLPEPLEVRIRVAGRASTAALAGRIGEEIEALYTNGPFGGGGATRSVREIIAIGSILMDRTRIAPQVEFEDV